MAKQNSSGLLSRLIIMLRGALIFFVVVAGSTYYLQDSLIIYKRYGSHAHWAVILTVVPLLAGLILRQLRICFPLLSTLLGALASAALLYPLYKTFWAEPPNFSDVIIYVVVVLGIGFIATQSLRNTFMLAFRMGRFSLTNSKPQKKKTARKTEMSRTQRLKYSEHGNVIALIELLIGLLSLGLSIFSIFFLGRS